MPPRRSTTHAPRNWSRSPCAARSASAVRPTPGSPCSTTTTGRVSVLARAVRTHWAIRASSARRPVNRASASGSCPNDCSSMLRRRASALRSAPRNCDGTAPRAAGPGPVALAEPAAATARSCARKGRIPRTSNAVSHFSLNCSGPPGRPAAPARRFAAGTCTAATRTAAVTAPATPATMPALSAVPASTPKATSAPAAAAEATAVTSRAVPLPARRKASPNDCSPAAASSSAAT